MVFMVFVAGLCGKHFFSDRMALQAKNVQKNNIQMNIGEAHAVSLCRRDFQSVRLQGHPAVRGGHGGRTRASIVIQ
jgi:hypothetical protein